jgi:guanylate kinase
MKFYTYKVINDKLEKSIEKIKSIIIKEREKYAG